MGEYRLQSTWHLPGPAERVYAALADVEGYPRWWHQMKRAVLLGDGISEFTCRSLLSTTLTVVASRVVEDPVGLRLRARLGGDLSGVVDWHVANDGSGSVAVLDQTVALNTSVGRAFGPVARPLFIAAHAAMMRAGERGLRRRLGR